MTNVTTRHVVVDGQTATLTGSNFLAAGGEGLIFKVKNKIIKIYHDDKKMVRDGMAEKIKSLATLNSPSVVAPQGTVTESGKNIGFWMNFADGEPLTRVFTSAFWLRNSFNFVQASHLVNKMRDVMDYVHSRGAIMVDPNEINWLADLKAKNGPNPIAIDVDSWTIGRWKSSTVMLHVRDYHNSAFTELTDWFSWAVVTFQIYSGIHPYRGILPGYSENITDVVKRMQENKSVFSPGVKLNRAVRDFNEIPKPLLSWYQATFEQGERSIPPTPYDKTPYTSPTIAHIQRTILTASGNLKFEKIFSKIGTNIKRVFPCGVAQADDGELFDLNSKVSIGKLPLDGEIVKVEEGWLYVWIENSNTKFMFISSSHHSSEIKFQISAQKLFRYENRLFVVNQNLLELSFMLVGGIPLVSATTSVQILANAQWFDGLGVQEIFGSKFLILPFGNKGCIIMQAKELEGRAIITAKAGLQFASLITFDRKGVYHKHELTFDNTYNSYKHWSAPTTGPSQNVAILPTRVCATIISDGELVIFVPSNGKLTRITDKAITTDKLLENWDKKVLYLDSDAVWWVST